jgi:hypothetical protein
LQKWDPKWAATCLKMTTDPWAGGVLSRKFIELVGVGKAAPKDRFPLADLSSVSLP